MNVNNNRNKLEPSQKKQIQQRKYLEQESMNRLIDDQQIIQKNNEDGSKPLIQSDGLQQKKFTKSELTGALKYIGQKINFLIKEVNLNNEALHQWKQNFSNKIGNEIQHQIHKQIKQSAIRIAQEQKDIRNLIDALHGQCENQSKILQSFQSQMKPILNLQLFQQNK